MRVVELGVWVAGPSAGGILADWGADVIKVEAPAGDPMRRMLALTVGHGQPASPPFDLDNRGKRSVVLDLAQPSHLQAMTRLLGTADVFITNLRVDALERLGLGADTVLAGHERLVYAHVTGYGRGGPDAGRPGYDVGAFWARTGIAATVLPPGEPPPGIRGGLGDHVTGITVLAGILAALLERGRTGKGQLVDVSLLRTGIYCLGWDHMLQLRFGKLAGTSPRTANWNPMINTYRAGDGKWFQLLGVEADRLWPKLMAALARPDLAGEPRFATARDRRKNAAEIIAILDEEFATRTRDDWSLIFDEHDVWFAPVLEPTEVADDPQALAAGAFVDVPGIEGVDGAAAHRAVASPVRFGATDVGPSGPVPALGQHIAEILTSLGYTDDDISRMFGR